MYLSNTSRRLVRAGVAVAMSVLSFVVVPGVLATAARADTVRGLAWHLDTLRVERAHRLSRGGGTVVAVIGSGVDADHPDLKGRVLRGRSYDKAAAADGREDGSDHGHDTGVAGLIVGPGGSDTRLLGIAPDARILPVNLGRSPTSDTLDRAIRWAADNGANVINVSVSLNHCSQEEYEAVRYALRKDVVVVAPAGDREYGVGVECPASVPGVIAVAGTTRTGGAWSDSITGRELALAAPAVKIIHPAPRRLSDNGYLVSATTGNAAAIVSGVAALVRAKYPDLDANNVVNRLIRTARDRDDKGRDIFSGYGVVDPVRALTARTRQVDANPLGTPPASPTPTPRPARSRADDGPAIEITVTDPVGAAIQAAVMVLVLVLVIVLVIRNRRSRQAGAAGPSLPPYGMPPQPGPHHPHQGYRRPPPYAPPSGRPAPPPMGPPQWQGRPPPPPPPPRR
ncbi:S8 family serine peptidase [Streptosporangium amethystogenes]|uniref:S8 family serine peptidase n=1 Tax=Streptosporangium amethystogenes TaxID=2002 RepID=UPI0006906485|nr:S8 family serine peptidase [Streptosporangium amethystogenes]